MEKTKNDPWWKEVEELVLKYVGSSVPVDLHTALLKLLRKASVETDKCIQLSQVKRSKKLYEIMTSFFLHFHVKNSAVKKLLSSPCYEDLLSAMLSLTVDLQLFLASQDNVRLHQNNAVRDVLLYLGATSEYIWDVIIQSVLLRQKNTNIVYPVIRRLMEAGPRETNDPKQFMKFLLAGHFWIKSTGLPDHKQYVKSFVLTVSPPTTFLNWYNSLNIDGLPRKTSLKKVAKLFLKKIPHLTLVKICDMLSEDIETPDDTNPPEDEELEEAKNQLFFIDTKGGEKAEYFGKDHLEDNINFLIASLDEDVFQELDESKEMKVESSYTKAEELLINDKHHSQKREKLPNAERRLYCKKKQNSRKRNCLNGEERSNKIRKVQEADKGKLSRRNKKLQSKHRQSNLVEETSLHEDGNVSNVKKVSLNRNSGKVKSSVNKRQWSTSSYEKSDEVERTMKDELKNTPGKDGKVSYSTKESLSQDGELGYSMEKSPRQDGELGYSMEKSPRQDGELDYSMEKSPRQGGKLDYSMEKSPRQDGELDYSMEKSPRQDGELDYSMEKSPRQDGELDYSTEKSPRQDGKLDHSTEKSLRQDGELDYSTEKSPRQDGELDYSTEKSPRQDGKLDYSTEKSPRQDGKLDYSTEKSPRQDGELDYSTEKSPRQDGELDYSTEKSPRQDGELGYSTEKSPGQGGKLGCNTEKSPGQGGKLGYSTEKSPGQGGKLGYSTEKSPGQGGKLGYSTEKSPGQGGRLGYSTEKSPRQGGRLGYSTEKSPRQGGRLGYSTEKSPRQGGRLGYSMEKSPKQGGRLGYSMEKSPKQGGKLGYSIEESPSCDEKLDYTSEESSHDIDGKLSFSTVKSPNKDERSNYSPRKSPSKYVKLSGNIKSPQKNNYRKQNILSEDQEMSCSEEKLQRDIEEGNDNDVVKLPNKFSYEEKESGENKKIVLGKENIFSSIGKESNEGVSDNHDSVNVEDSVKKERFKISPINDIQLINSSHITRSLSKLRTSTLRRSTRVRTQSNISCELGSTAGEASLKTADALKNMFVATDKLEELASSDAPIEDIKVLKTCTPAHKINKQMNNNLAREPVVHLSLTEFGCHSKGSSQSETEQHSFISGSLDPVMPEKEMVSDSEDSVKNLGSIVRLRSRRLLESGDETSKDSAIVCDEGFKDESSKQPASNNEVSSISSPTHGYELRTPHAKLITSIRKRYIENIDECSNENPSLLPKLSPTKSRSLVFEDTTEDLHCSVLLQLDTSEMPPKVYNVTPSKSFSSCTEFSKRKSLNIVKGSDVENSKEPSVSSNVGEFHSPSVQLRNKSVTDTSLSGRKEKPSYSLSQKLVTDSNVPLTRNSPRKIEYNLRSRRKSSGTPNKRN